MRKGGAELRGLHTCEVTFPYGPTALTQTALLADLFSILYEDQIILSHWMQDLVWDLV